MINRDLAGEAPALLASYVVQGTLLGAEWPDSSADEAVVAALFGTLAYGEFVALEPDLAAHQTTATIERNRDLLALLNSGPRTDEGAAVSTSSVGFLAAPAGVSDILPGLYADSASFAEYVTASLPVAEIGPRGAMAAPPVFAKYLRFAGIAPSPPQSDGFVFDRGTMRDLDLGLDAFLSASDALVLAEALGLGVAAV
jgi:hypothetical protein